MKFGWSLALAALFTAGSAFAQDTTSDKGKLSYAMGFQLGSRLSEQKSDIDIATFTRALQDAYASKTPAVPAVAMATAMQNYEKKMRAAAEKELGDNKREADTFMASNRSKKGIIALPNGVQYRAIEDGSGRAMAATSEVTFHVRLSLTSGREVRSSFVGEPIKAKVSDMPNIFGTQLLPEVIQKMKTGDHWIIYLPPEQASGNQVYVWDIKILNVQ
jgi:FKBP-type peptidyl-prolyl cis-trans isomerase